MKFDLEAFKEIKYHLSESDIDSVYDVYNNICDCDFVRNKREAVTLLFYLGVAEGKRKKEPHDTADLDNLEGFAEQLCYEEIADFRFVSRRLDKQGYKGTEKDVLLYYLGKAKEKQQC